MNELDLFTEALALTDPLARAALLDKHCAGNPQLRLRLEELLTAHGKADNVLPRMPAIDPNVTSAFSDVNQVGNIIAGKYKLREKLGEGGMGSVWVADQLEPVQRRVAIKLIKTGSDSKSMLARFEQERQALALMDHPHIAKVFDAGIDQQPYFVMELIKGVPLTKYCDDARLTAHQRLELFVPVCQAVQHAHQKGIIHRDLKPGNILVGLYDGKPVPKVIDFGVAKATASRLTEQSIYTEVGSLVGTLEYMSPEQAELNNLDIDTRSDIYALGVILYELLTGSVPFNRKELSKAGFGEMLRVIKEVEPPKPSTKLSGSGTLSSIAASRHTEPAKLTRLVKGDLDWIVMKALEKDRSRRYETANGFAADVQRYLSGEAVYAVPPSTSYRLKKFVARNKGPVLAASLIVVVLLLGMAGTLWGWYEANLQRDEADRERQDAIAARHAALDAQEKMAQSLIETSRAKLEAIKKGKLAEAAKAEAQSKEAEANAVVKFFEDKVFAAARPKGQEGGLGAGVTLRDAIVASLPALEKAFAAQPVVEARLRRSLGNTFRYLGEYEQTRDQFAQSLALFTRHLGPDHHTTLSSMNNLAFSYAALNRPAEAAKLLEEVLEIRKRVLSKDHPATLRTKNDLAISYSDLKRHAEALKLHEEVLEVQKRVLPKDHVDTLMSMGGLANSYAALNRPTEALKLREEVLEIRKRVLPRDHPDTLISMNNLALSYAALNRPADALKLLEEVLEIQKRLLPEGHPDTLMSMGNLANRHAALRRYAEASKLREETLEIRKRVLPKDHPHTLRSMDSLAYSYVDLNRHAEAFKLYEESLAIRKRVLPKDHPDILVSMWGLAATLISLDRGAEAIPLIDECVAKAAGQTVDPRMIPTVIGLRLEHFQKVGDPAGCRATAAMWEKLNRSDADSLYNAACYRAVTAAVQAKTPEADAVRPAKEDADRAMDWLHKAVAAGYKDAAHIKKDPDLVALREREDFKKLLADLEKAR